MTAPLRSLERGHRVGFLTCAALILMTAGCLGEHGHGRRDGRDEPPMPPVTPMAGSEAFFDGRLVAEINVVPLSMRRPDKEDGKADGNAAKGRGLTGDVQANGNNRGTNVGGGLGYDFGGTNLGLGLGGGGLGLTGGIGGAGGGGQGGGDGHGGGGEPSREGGRGVPPMLLGGTGSIAVIHLRFTNLGKDRLEFRVVDFRSPIGNFVVRPEKLALDPGQWTETDPMSSQMDGWLTETEVRLVLRTSEKTETKTVILRARSAPVSSAGGKPEQPSNNVQDRAAADSPTP